MLVLRLAATPTPQPCPVSQQNTQTLPGRSWGPHLCLLLPWLLAALELQGGGTELPSAPAVTVTVTVTPLSFRKLPGV